MVRTVFELSRQLLILVLATVIKESLGKQVPVLHQAVARVKPGIVPGESRS